MNINFSEVFKKLRRERELTQEQAAEVFCVSPQAVSRWENAQTSPDISLLPIIAEYFGVSIETLLGVDIARKEEKVKKILKRVNDFQEQGDHEASAKYLREQLKTYPNEPDLLTNLASALQTFYFHQGKADTEELKKEKSDEIIALCERALKYYKPTDDNNFTKQVLIGQYVYYLHDKENGERLVMSLPNVYCTRERFLADLYEGKEALARRQSALLWSMTQMMHRLFWEISRDDFYTYEQKIEILKTDDALTELITGEKPNFFHCKLSVNAAVQAELYLKLGDKEKALEMLWSAYDHAESYISRPVGEKYAPCWLSEMDDDQIKVLKMDPKTNFDTIYDIITKPDNKFCEVFGGNERFERLVEKLKEKISK